MKRKLKVGVVIIIGLLLSLCLILGFGFWTMTIEDKYGDLQEIYYNSQDGDLIVLTLKGKKIQYGIIHKNWNAVYVEAIGTDSTLDLNQWVGFPNEMNGISLFRGDFKSVNKLSGIDQKILNEMIQRDLIREIK